MSRVYIFLADGFEDIEGLTVVDLMRRAEIDIKTVSIKNSKEVTTSHGIALLTDCIFEETDFSDADMLVLPGGMPGTKYLGEYAPLTELLKSFYGKGDLLSFLYGKIKRSRSHRGACGSGRQCDNKQRAWDSHRFCPVPYRTVERNGKSAGNRRIYRIFLKKHWCFDFACAILLQ